MVKKISFIFLCIFLFNACSYQPTPKTQIKHIVFLWLKDSGNEVHTKTIIETTQDLKNIPGVLDVSVGKVIKSERKIVDDSFDVGLTLSFATHEDMQSYLVHPTHKKAVQKILKPLFKKIIVYDYKEGK